MRIAITTDVLLSLPLYQISLNQPNWQAATGLSSSDTKLPQQREFDRPLYAQCPGALVSSTYTSG